MSKPKVSMSEMRERLLAAKNGGGNGGGAKTRGPDSFLAFWNIPERQALGLRFLPDADESNPFFWRERDMINIPFEGVKGLHTDKVTVTVPCNEMWDKVNTCPILKVVRTWWDDKDTEELARTYWKKKSYLLQCLIAPNSVEVKDDQAPENPIRRVLVTKQVFSKIESILLDPDLVDSPTDYENGLDFRIIKTKNSGGFNSYDESKFAMKTRPLSEEEMAAIEKYGTFNLNDFMPKRPTAADLVAIEEMFEASLRGEAYDPERWAEFYRPAGVSKPNSTAGAAPAATPAQEKVTPKAEPKVEAKAPVAETPAPAAEDAPEDVPTTPAGHSDLLARLRAQRG